MKLDDILFDFYIERLIYPKTLKTFSQFKDFHQNDAL